MGTIQELPYMFVPHKSFLCKENRKMTKVSIYILTRISNEHEDEVARTAIENINVHTKVT